MSQSPSERHSVTITFGKTRTRITFDYASQRAQHEARDSFRRHPGIIDVLCSSVREGSQSVRKNAGGDGVPVLYDGPAPTYGVAECEGCPDYRACSRLGVCRITGPVPEAARRLGG